LPEFLKDPSDGAHLEIVPLERGFKIVATASSKRLAQPPSKRSELPRETAFTVAR
jgi:hypothetical protein